MNGRIKVKGIEYPLAGYVIRVHKSKDEGLEASLYYSDTNECRRYGIMPNVTFFETPADAYAAISSGKVKLYSESELPQILRADCFVVLSDPESEA